MTSAHWYLDDSKTKLCGDLATTPPARFELDADELDSLIAHLAEMRSAMEPPIALADPDKGMRLPAARNGRWFVQPRGREGAAIFLLHPGHRWVGLALEPESARDLIRILLQSLPLSAPSDGP